MNINEVSGSGDERCIVVGGADVGGLVGLLDAIRAPCGARCCNDVPLIGASAAPIASVNVIA